MVGSDTVPPVQKIAKTRHGRGSQLYCYVRANRLVGSGISGRQRINRYADGIEAVAVGERIAYPEFKYCGSS